MNATVTPNKSHIPIQLIKLGHDSPLQRNLTKWSDHEKFFEDGFDSDGGRGPFMEAVDEEGEQNSEEELLSKNGEATSANEDDSIASKIPTP